MGRRGPRATDTATSIVRTGEAERLNVGVAHRWECSCGEAGEWVPRHDRRTVGPKQNTPAELARVTLAWEKHLRERHPDVVDDAEWLEEESASAARAAAVDEEAARSARVAARRALAAAEYD